MNFDEENLKRNVQDKDTWVRFVYLVVLGIALYLAVVLTFAIAVFQFFAKLFSGAPFDEATKFGESLALYLNQTAQFLTFASDEKPFPFSQWRRSDVVTPPATSTSND